MFRNLFSVLALMAITFFINPKPAQAAVSDCASQGCFAVCTSAGPVEMYFNNGTHAGTITHADIGSGYCSISAGEGYLVLVRGDSIIRTYDVENGVFYSLDIQASMEHSTVFNGYAYVTASGDNTVRKVSLDCSGSTTITTTGIAPAGITHDSSTIYVINAFSADVTTIVPPATTSTLHSIGRVVGDMVNGVRYHSGNNVLYVTGLAGVYEVPLPLSGTSSLWQALPALSGFLSLTDTHLGVSSSDGNSAYLIPVATPSSYLTMGCASCRFTAINDTTLYTVGGNTPDVGVKVWNMSGTQETYSPVTTANSYSAAYLAPTVAAPVCPNGIKETGEACDGTQFGTTTCQTLGFDGGSLTCTGTCTIDTSSCFYNCGNGAIDSGEQCDGSNLNGQDCTDLGFSSGTLSCDANCDFVTTQCVSPTCGDSTVDTGEECDGDNNGETCQSLGYDGGQLSCSSTSCTFNTSLCSTCGNNTLEFGEECDGTQFGGESCQSQGFTSGTIACSASCTLDTSACTNEVDPVCGNGLLENGEQCDDDNINAGDGCDDNCQVEDGYTCEGEPSDCSLQNTCNQDGLIADSTVGLDFQKLSSHNLNLYNSHLESLTKGYTLECGTVEIYGNELEAITVNLEAGTYADLALQIGDKVAQCHFFAEEGAAKIHINANDFTKAAYVDGGSGAGIICTEDNANVQVQFQGLILGALGTGFSYRRLSADPRTNLPGEWLEIYVSDSSVRLQELSVATNFIVVATSDMNDGPLYINLTAIGDLSEIFTPPTTPPPKGCGSCSVSGNGDPALPIMFLAIFILLMIRRRKVSGSR